MLLPLHPFQMFYKPVFWQWGVLPSNPKTWESQPVATSLGASTFLCSLQEQTLFSLSCRSPMHGPQMSISCQFVPQTAWTRCWHKVGQWHKCHTCKGTISIKPPVHKHSGKHCVHGEQWKGLVVYIDRVRLEQTNNNTFHICTLYLCYPWKGGGRWIEV